MRARRERAARERVAARALEGSLLSLAALLGNTVKDADGHDIGALRDVVVQWTAEISYPAVSGIVIRSGERDVLINSRWLEFSAPGTVRLHSTRAYARAVKRGSGTVALAHDVLDHQVVDSGGAQIVRPADVYLATVGGRVELVGIEVGVHALLRRLGPKRLRGRIRPQRVIDWASVDGFAPRPGVDAPTPRSRSRFAGRPGAGIELRARAADVRPLRPSEVETALKRKGTAQDREPA